MGDLEGKIAVVTGGSGALGTAVVTELARRGALVHVPSRRAAGAGGLAAPASAGAAVVHAADVADPASVERLFAAVGPLDLLVNAAGTWLGGPIDAAPAEQWAALLTINATTAYLCCRAAVPRMRARGGGRIVNVASVSALPPGAPNAAAYAASKAAVLSLTQSLAGELLRDHITVNALVPTTLDTPANRRAMPDADRSAWLDPAAVARLIAFLAGPDAAILTGAALNLAAG